MTDLTTFLLSLGGIILVDLILSGDNALIIGVVAARISQRRQRWLVLVFGGLGAILVRILFTVSTTFLLRIPYLQTVGGLLVLTIAIRLLFDDPPSAKSSTEKQDPPSESSERQLPALVRLLTNRARSRERKSPASRNSDFFMAIITITIADLTMSLDNIVAVGALAHGQVVPLAIGLVLSIALLIVGSALISELTNRIPGLMIITSFILAWVSANLVWNDLHNLSFVENNPAIYTGLLVGFLSLTLVFTLVTRLQRFRMATRSSS